MEEEKVRVKLTKVPLESEREEKKKNRIKTIVLTLVCVFFLVFGAVGGFVFSSYLKGTSVAAFKSEKFDKILSYFKSVWLYANDYDDLETTMQDKAFYGMSTFNEDPYTSYMSYDDMNAFASSINMNYVGIGAQYSYSNGIGTITRVFKESPAEKGGLMPGDILYLIDGKSIEGLTSDQIKERIVGEEGTPVKITVLRNEKEVELTFIRGAIEYTAYLEKYDDYIYLDIMSFGQSTAEECIKYLDECTDYSKLIINLRDNSGGYQDSVQEVAGLFLGEDKVVLNETDNTGKTRSFKTIVKKYYDNFEDIVVLINENTASAAEVLAIALKEMHPNVTLVGAKTYGKGVVQTSYYLDDGSAVKITSSYWTSPNGKSINKEGVLPDEAVRQDEIMYQIAYSMEEGQTFEYDSVSEYVRIAELALEFLDYKVNRTDGYFDTSFEAALNKYKIDHGYENVEPVLDSSSYNAILAEVIKEYNLNNLKDKQLQAAIELIRE